MFDVIWRVRVAFRGANEEMPCFFLAKFLICDVKSFRFHTPTIRRVLARRLPRPHKKGFDQPAFVVEDFDGKLLTLRQLEVRAHQMEDWYIEIKPTKGNTTVVTCFWIVVSPP